VSLTLSSPAEPILEDVEQVAALLVPRRGRAPVIEEEEEDVHPGEFTEELAVGAVGTRQERRSSKRREARR
jgi:hypothetical protein